MRHIVKHAVTRAVTHRHFGPILAAGALAAFFHGPLGELASRASQFLAGGRDQAAAVMGDAMAPVVQDLKTALQLLRDR